MKAVKKWRYYCDFCKKSGMAKHHMATHEKSCTLNPARECRLCKHIDEPCSPMADMLAVLPDPAMHMKTVNYGDSWAPMADMIVLDDEAFKPLLEAGMVALRQMTYCPVCIMAALRQKKIPVPLAEGFDFKKELASIWQDINSMKGERDDNGPQYY